MNYGDVSKNLLKHHQCEHFNSTSASSAKSCSPKFPDCFCFLFYVITPLPNFEQKNKQNMKAHETDPAQPQPSLPDPWKYLRIRCWIVYWKVSQVYLIHYLVACRCIVPRSLTLGWVVFGYVPETSWKDGGTRKGKDHLPTIHIQGRTHVSWLFNQPPLTYPPPEIRV